MRCDSPQTIDDELRGGVELELEGLVVPAVIAVLGDIGVEVGERLRSGGDVVALAGQVRAERPARVGLRTVGRLPRIVLAEALRGARMPWNDVLGNAVLFASLAGIDPAAIARVTRLPADEIAARVEDDPLIGHPVRHFAAWGGIDDVRTGALDDAVEAIIAR